MSINFNTYDQLPLHQKIELFDEVSLYLGKIDLSDSQKSKKLKKQLIHIVDDNSENSYLRQCALETICKLTISKTNSFRSQGTFDLLLDLELDDEPFILTLAVKYLFYLHSEGESQAIDKLRKFCAHKSAEVSSEAYFRLGQIYFFKEKDNNFLKNLTRSQEFFQKAIIESKNRIDAKLFCSLTKILLTPNKEEQKTQLSQIASIIWTIEVFTESHTVHPLYMGIYRIVLSFIELSNKKVDTFIDKSQYDELVSLHYSIINEELTNTLDDFFIKQFKENLKTEYIEPFYANNFKAQKSRLNELKNNANTENEITFWEAIIELDKEQISKKKNFNTVLLSVKELFPDVPTDDIIKNLGNEDLEDTTKLIQRLIRLRPPKIHSMKTGSNIGDDILKDQMINLRKRIPNYDKNHLLEFELIFADIIRYVHRTTQASKNNPDFLFLFNKDALEKELQVSMMNALRMISDRASFYSEESPESTDGGRIDIKYESSSLTIPIELKRTKNILDEDKIKRKYLSQAQTYTYNKNQLGFFVILDSSEKDKQKPMNDLRDLFGIMHLDTQHRVNERHPDYIIWCIVPGNKMLPSERSSYN